LRGVSGILSKISCIRARISGLLVLPPLLMCSSRRVASPTRSRSSEPRRSKSLAANLISLLRNACAYLASDARASLISTRRAFTASRTFCFVARSAICASRSINRCRQPKAVLQFLIPFVETPIFSDRSSKLRSLPSAQ